MKSKHEARLKELRHICNNGHQENDIAHAIS